MTFFTPVSAGAMSRTPARKIEGRIPRCYSRNHNFGPKRVRQRRAATVGKHKYIPLALMCVMDRELFAWKLIERRVCD